MKKHVACEMRQVADDMEGEWLGWVGGKGEGKKNQHFCSCMQNDLTGTRAGALRLCPSERLCRLPGWLQSNAKCRHRGDGNGTTYTHTLTHIHRHSQRGMHNPHSRTGSTEKGTCPSTRDSQQIQIQLQIQIYRHRQTDLSEGCLSYCKVYAYITGGNCCGNPRIELPLCM